MTPERVGRYVLLREVAAGGMASVVLGRMLGPGGFGKTVAIKRLHPQFAKDQDFVSMFLDEARVTSGLSHPNIVMTLDVLEQPGELLLVMEYVHGAALSSVLRIMKERGEAVPPRIASAIIAGTLHGLHAAHEARGDAGERLDVVHRDVSPQNILISTDGVPKIADFGIAKAVGQVHSTSEGVMKGKFAYMAPEQAQSATVSARTDVFAAGIVLWELLTSERLVGGVTNAERLLQVLTLAPAAPTSKVPGLSAAFDAITARALATKPEDRYPTARAMAMDIETQTEVANASEVSAWLTSVAADSLRSREELLSEMQRLSFRDPTSSSPFLGVADSARAIPEGETVSVSELTVDPTAASARRRSRAPDERSRALSRGMVIGIIVGSLTLAATGSGLFIAARTPTAASPSSLGAGANGGANGVAPPEIPSATTPSTATSASAATPTTATVTATATATATATVASSPATSALTAPTPKPRPTAAPTTSTPAGTGNCKIEVAVDANGRTQFKEVCKP